MASRNTNLCQPILGALLSHLRKYYEKEEDVNPPIKLEPCVKSEGDKVLPLEPLVSPQAACEKVANDLGLCDTVEHTYDACPKYRELGSFRIIAYLYISDGSRRRQSQYSKKKVQRFYI